MINKDGGQIILQDEQKVILDDEMIKRYTAFNYEIQESVSKKTSSRYVSYIDDLKGAKPFL